MWRGVSQMICERNRLIGVLLMMPRFARWLLTQTSESDKSSDGVDGSLEWWAARFSMSNDANFLPLRRSPIYPDNNGPAMTIDGRHNNFHVITHLITHLIKALADALSAGGYHVTYSTHSFSDEVLKGTDSLVVMSAMSNNFRQGEPCTGAFQQDELGHLEKWIAEGGSLLVSSQHFPFDRAVKPPIAGFWH